MVDTNHHLVIELDASQKRALRLARDAQSRYRTQLMRSLDQYCSPAARRHGLITASDVKQLLAARTYTNIPRHMLDLTSMPRHRRCHFTDTPLDDSRRGTTLKRLHNHNFSGASSPDAQGITPTEGALSPLSADVLAVSCCEPRARSIPAPAVTMWTNHRAFSVSLSRPLPLSYDAQCDVRYVTGARRRSSLHLESGYAPLFTQSRTSRLICDADHEASPREEQALRFLHVDHEANPRALTQKRLHEKHRWDRKKGPSKTELNAPKRMPQLLGKKMGKDKVPACAGRSTESMEQHREGSQARRQRLQEQMSAGGRRWCI